MRLSVVEQICDSTRDGKIQVRLFDEVDRTFAHRGDGRAHIRIFTQKNDWRRGAISAYSPEQFQSGHAGQRHVGDQTAAGFVRGRSEITLRAVVVLDFRVQVFQ